MNLWARIKSVFKPKGFNSWSGAADQWYFGIPAATKSGARIDQITAMGLPAVWACIRLLSESIASLPLHLYFRQPRGKIKALNHPLYSLMHDAPNPEMSSMTFRETMAAHILAWGNCFAEKQMNGVGEVQALWPLPPNRVEIKRETFNGPLTYTLRLDNGETRTFTRNQILHIPGLGFDGITGYSPIAKLREAIGVASSLEEFGARFFGQGTHPGIVVSHPGHLTEQGSKNLRDSLAAKYSGLGQSHRLMLLEEAMKVEKIGIPPNEAQFIETKKFQLAEIARIYRIPLHMLQEIERGASYASVEQMSQEFVTYTLRPWLVRFEQGYNGQLLSPLDKIRLFWEHLIDGLLRGDMTSRYDAYNIARNGGWMSANDIRELENLNPISPKDGGDDYWIPANMSIAGAPAPPPPAPSPEPTPMPEKMPKNDLRGFWAAKIGENPVFTSFFGLFVDVFEQILSREGNSLKRVLEKANGDFDAQLEEFYGLEIRDYFLKKLSPAFQALILSQKPTEKLEIIPNLVGDYIQKHIADSKAMILAAPDRKKTLDEFHQRSELLAQTCLTGLLEQVRAQNASI